MTIPIVLNSARYILLNTLYKEDQFPKDVWGPVGITTALISLVFANVNEAISDYLNYRLNDIANPLMKYCVDNNMQYFDTSSYVQEASDAGVIIYQRSINYVRFRNISFMNTNSIIF